MKASVGWLKNSKKKRSMAIPLILTSLVDAFCMIMVYLMLATNMDSSVEVSPGVELPSAQRAEQIQESPVVTIWKSEYFFESQKLSFEQLKAKLHSRKDLFHQKKKAIVEADHGTPYAKIEPVMALMSELEVESIQLAVVTQETL